MKKETSSKILLGLVTFIFLSSLLSFAVLAADAADPEAIREASKNAGIALIAPFAGMAEGILTVIFGGEWVVGTRVFLFVLLILLVYSVIPLVLGQQFETERKWVNFLISFVVSTLAIIAIPAPMLDALLVQYGAMGAALLTMIPFMIILFFSIRTENALAARVVWIFYAFYYLALYMYKFLGAFGITADPKPITPGEAMLYIAAFMVGLGLFFGIGVIRNVIFKGEVDALKETGDKRIKKAKLGQNMLIHTADTLGNN